MSVRKVHVVFKTHLDVGFTDSAANVVQTYFDSYIPNAIKTAHEVNNGREKPAFIWTTGSWLIYEYLRTQESAKVRALEEAIDRGYIAWHALPFTTHTELMDESLFSFGLSLSDALDRRFGRKTIAAKMTDVPGHTIGIVSPLVRHGIKYLHIGVNEGSPVPDVPEFFVWRDGNGMELIMNYANDYGAVHTIDGFDEALAFVFTEDNEGPSNIDDIYLSLDGLSAMFPEAEVFASTLDAFAEALLRIRDRLPVVTAEIGDTWIHGIATDPAKVSKFKGLLRLRDKWLAEGKMDLDTEEYNSFCRTLLLVPEHTWGMDLKTFLPDFANYRKDDFNRARKKDIIGPDSIPEKYSYMLSRPSYHSKKTYSAFEASWEEQRAYLGKAMECLRPEKRKEAETAMQALVPVRKRKFAQALPPGEPISIGGHIATFRADGSISCLEDNQGRILSGNLAAFAYQCYGAEDYYYWHYHYSQNPETCGDWVLRDFGKPGLELLQPLPEQKVFIPVLESLSINAAGNTVQAISIMPDEACTVFGAPRVLHTEYVFGADRIEVEFQWFDKDSNRMPEALWLGFQFGASTGRIMMRKLGSLVSPCGVVSRGNRNLHACTALQYEEAGLKMDFESLDAPLISARGMDILKFNDEIPKPGGDVYVNLFNNIWGTNFPMWYGDDGRVVFHINFK